MSRVARVKRAILPLILALASAVALMAAFDFHPLAVAGVLAVVLGLRQAQRRVLWEYFRGRRLLKAGQPRAALELFERCRTRLQAEPWRRRWFMLVSVYTPSADAALLHASGTAHLLAGDLDGAEAAFREALAADPHFPLPHFHMAVLAELRGDREAASRHASEARRLGYPGASPEAVARAAQSVASRLGGRAGAAG